uniref:Uncharacterized protein n=1 Tax=Timema tahoe TaxID=61484 RepID=A0A7R9IKK2_9NEOP|nr:unnamed protein product [Timema tahoe]
MNEESGSQGYGVVGNRLGHLYPEYLLSQVRPLGGQTGALVSSIRHRQHGRLRAEVTPDCIKEACSSRSTPKPRPPSPTARPNITFHTYACPPAYAKWYCLNEATCFTVKIGESLLYNCE